LKIIVTKKIEGKTEVNKIFQESLFI